MFCIRSCGRLFVQINSTKTSPYVVVMFTNKLRLPYLFIFAGFGTACGVPQEPASSERNIISFFPLFVDPTINMSYFLDEMAIVRQTKGVRSLFSNLGGFCLAKGNFCRSCYLVPTCLAHFVLTLAVKSIML